MIGMSKSADAVIAGRDSATHTFEAILDRKSDEELCLIARDAAVAMAEELAGIPAAHRVDFIFSYLDELFDLPKWPTAISCTVIDHTNIDAAIAAGVWPLKSDCEKPCNPTWWSRFESTFHPREDGDGGIGP